MSLIHEVNHPVVGGIRVGSVDSKGNYRITGSCIVYQIGNTVIDTGPAREWRIVRDFFQAKEIERALITHYHEDHSGNGKHFQQQLGCQVHSHAHNHDTLSNGFKLSLARKRAFGLVECFSPSELPAQVTTGNHLTLQPVHLPGHSHDMTGYFEPNEGWLFSGDLYIASKVKYMMAEEDVGQLIDSLRAALALEFDTLFCSHRGVIDDGKNALGRKLDFIVSLREEVAHLHERGLNARAITRKLLGREDATRLLSFNQLTKINVVRACLKSL